MNRLDVEDVLRELGLQPHYAGSKWMLLFCPFHDDRRHPSFLVSRVDGGWRCESEAIFGSLPQLVAKLKGWKVGEAARWLGRFNQVKAPSSDELVKALMGRRDGELSQGDDVPFETHRFPSFMRERGFEPRALKRFGVGFDPRTGAAVIPMEKHRVYRYPPEAEVRYMYTPGYPKSTRLFREDLWGGPDAVLVEGTLDCIWLHQHGWRGGLAILGRTLSEYQADWLFRHATRVVLFFDNDEAGLDATKQAMLRLRNETFVARPVRKDAQECSAEELDSCLTSARPALEWLLEQPR